MRLDHLGAGFTALALGALLVGGANGTSCLSAIDWKGAQYTGSGPSGLSFTDRIGAGEFVPCLDSAGAACSGSDGPDDPATILRIPGVDPAVAVGVAETSNAYLADGYVLESPRHPLHRALFRSASRPNERAAGRCRPGNRLSGSVESRPPAAFRLDVDGGPDPQILLDARTRFEGLDRRGVPYLGEDARVAVDTIACPADGGRTKLVADRVVVLVDGR